MTEGPMTGRSAAADPARRAGPGPDPRTAITRLAIGVMLMLAAAVLFAASRLVASGQLHSYDPGATPAASVQLTAGKQYQLSSPAGVSALQKAGLLTSLACSWSTDGNLLNPLTITTTLTDDRDLRTFATFNAPSTGRLQIACTGIDKVFVDDSDSSGTDYSATLVLLTVAVGLLGVILAVTGWYQLSERPAPAYRDAELFDDFDDFDADQD